MFKWPAGGIWRLVAVATAVWVLAGLAAAAAIAAGPEYVSPPEIQGQARLGERLVCGSGTWKGTPSFTYEWIREGVGFTTGPTYTLVKADEHKEIWCVVTASEVVEKGVPPKVGVAESINGVCLAGACGEKPPPIAPKSTSPPKVSGPPEVGKNLSCSPGTWEGRPSPTFTYKWLRDKAESIKAATSSTYTIVAADETHALSCRVTASNEGGEATAESENSVAISGTPPKNTTKPEVRGVPAVNEVLTCYQGTWAGSEPLSYEFRWRVNGVETNATASTRIVEAADEGKELSCKVVATNGAGKAEAVSAAVVVTSVKLESTGAPAISGTPEEANTLTCSDGTWNEPAGELKLQYNWLRDKSVTIGTEKQYKVTGADLGHLLYCQVVAKNEARGQQAIALSEPVGVKKGPGVPIKGGGEPVKIEGTRSLGSTLTCNHGDWSLSPTQFVYQWFRDAVAVSGAEPKYLVEAVDQGHSLMCKVIAENSEGPSEPAESLPAHVVGEAPSVQVLPEVIGPNPPHAGESLSCLRGKWKGAPAPTFAYEWLLDGAKKAGATGFVYTVEAIDRGHKLSCAVTASNGEGGPKTASSSNFLKVPGIPPEPPLEGVKIAGEPPSFGTELKCMEGSWLGAPTPTFTYQWLLNGTAIPGATSQAFTVGSADRGFMLSCRVTGTSSEGTAVALSPGERVRGLPPQSVEAPFITGGAQVGQTLTCQRGIWSGKPPPSFLYRWLRDGVPIASVGEAAYIVEPGDQGHLLSCSVTATNSEGSLDAESANSVAIGTRLLQTISETAFTGHPSHPVIPSPGVILGAVNRQLSFALENVHIKGLLKGGGYSFAFIAPTAGTFEVLWYTILKGAHGAKAKQLVVAQLTTVFTSAKKGTLRLKLTAKGRQFLKHKRRLTLNAKASFTIPHGKPVVWSSKFVLKS